jgi:hypothetical protein
LEVSIQGNGLAIFESNIAMLDGIMFEKLGKRNKKAQKYLIKKVLGKNLADFLFYFLLRMKRKEVDCG